MDSQKLIEQLKKEGFTDVMETPHFDPNMEFGEHTHEETTVHIILEGELILIEKGEVKTLKQGDRIEISAGTTHNAKTGPKGMKMIVGVKAK